MYDYRVTYFDGDDPDEIQFLFLCQAEDWLHAIEQCRDAYPDCVIVNIKAAPLDISEWLPSIPSAPRFKPSDEPGTPSLDNTSSRRAR